MKKGFGKRFRKQRFVGYGEQPKAARDTGTLGGMESQWLHTEFRGRFIMDVFLVVYWSVIVVIILYALILFIFSWELTVTT